MSASNSPESELPKTRARDSSRYDRAAQTAAVTPLDKQRKETKDATRTQAQQDRSNRDAERAKQRGKAAEIDDVAALFGAPKANGGADPSATVGDRKSARSAERDDQDADKAGRGPQGPTETPRPALEFDDDEDAGEDQPSKRRKKANLLEAYAEAHEIQPKELYDLEIGLEEGDEPISIGALKDHYKETRDLERRRDEFEEWHAESQNEIIQSRAQIEGVLQRLTQVVPPEAMARAFADMQGDFQARTEKARGQLREWFPEWSDVQVKARDREKLETALATYGFSKFEVGAVSDARLVKFAMDAIRLMERHKRLREGYEREKKPSTEPTSKRTARRPTSTDRANELAAKGDKIGAVTTLLGG